MKENGGREVIEGCVRQWLAINIVIPKQERNECKANLSERTWRKREYCDTFEVLKKV